MFFRRKTGPVDWLVAGLGNPGKKYEKTRHNIGFDALDAVAAAWGVEVKRSRFDALSGEGRVAGLRVLLLKPQTFMNLSGVSVQKAADFYKISPGHVLVFSDDVALPPGRLRIRPSGSAGGQKGLASIIASLGDGFPRLRIGVGDRPRPEYDLADWVLGRFTQAERKAVEARFADIAAAAELIMTGHIDEAMSRFNTK